jgi:5-methylthioribose kinase
MMINTSSRGCMLLANFLGYTSYITETGLEHAKDILSELLRAVVARIKPILRIQQSKLWRLESIDDLMMEGVEQ